MVAAFAALEQAFIRRAKATGADLYELAASVQYDPYVLARVVEDLNWNEREKLFLDKYNPLVIDAYKEQYAAEAKKLALTAMYGEDNPFALSYVEREGARLVRYVDVTTRSSINKAITRGIDSGLNPRQTAREIADLVDLLPQHVDAVQRRRGLLLRKGMAASRVSKETTRYADKLLKYRAENIARTEMNNAQEQANLDTWLEGQQAGFISPTAKKKWLAPMDERSCPTCGYLHDLPAIPLQSVWQPPQGNSLLRPTAHPSCRCTMYLILD